ncbi:MAG: hypothetical protein COW63_05460 [Bacteroidetes bacterium CG18_big_fil_WC_8_21_14_2_50_41_14]|nr:MAG: hypothetical protein COW63_05460 [Bacteroidetes bacterium CG18_big_fil_WC_8_21_14_2_50_41_14]
MKYWKSLTLIMAISLTFVFTAQAQNAEYSPVNTVSNLLKSDQRITFGGYGQIDYNQPFGNNTLQNGNLDVHRLVLMFGYRFSDKLSLVSEIEVEHVQEVYIEQAFLNYSFAHYLQVRAGLMLVPMGIINEYHEPTNYHGVERPLIDSYIVPTTWREIGIGFTGIIPEASMRYQAYLMNGFSSYNGAARLSGKNGLRKGRQKGAESIILKPSLAFRAEYYGLLGLNLGLSAYAGQTQSSLYKSLSRDDQTAIARADSSVVSVKMLGVDVRYQRKALEIRGQFYHTWISNALEYNVFTASNGVYNDLGSTMVGYYAEVAYNLFYGAKFTKTELIPFVRYSVYNTQASVAEGFIENEDYQKEVITGGIDWKVVSGVVLKADVQLIKPKSSEGYSQAFDAGIAIWF